jgi:hypothetical protein
MRKRSQLPFSRSIACVCVCVREGGREGGRERGESNEQQMAGGLVSLNRLNCECLVADRGFMRAHMLKREGGMDGEAGGRKDKADR